MTIERTRHPQPPQTPPEPQAQSGPGPSPAWRATIINALAATPDLPGTTPDAPATPGEQAAPLEDDAGAPADSAQHPADAAHPAQDTPQAVPPALISPDAVKRDPTARAVRELSTASQRSPDPLGLRAATAREASAPGDPAGPSPDHKQADASPAPKSDRSSAPSRPDAPPLRPDPAAPANASPSAPASAPSAPTTAGDPPASHADTNAAVAPANARPLPATPAAAAATSPLAPVGAAKGVSAAAAQTQTSRSNHALFTLVPPGKRPGLTPTPVASPSAAPPAGPDEALPAQVLRGLAAAFKQRGGSVTLRLAPEALGQVRVDMKLSEGAVSVRIHPQTEQARRLLTESASSLRTALEDQGLRVERLTVEPAAAERPGPARSDTPQAHEPARSDADPSGWGASHGGGGHDRSGAGGQGRRSASFTSGGALAPGGDPGGVTHPHADLGAELLVLGLDLTA